MRTDDNATLHDTVPPELGGWNWAAFGLNWIWGLAHRSYAPLLVFVPFVGLVVPFIAGAMGNRWAWRNGRWDSVEQFKRVQQRWARYTLLSYALAIVCTGIAVAVLIGAIKHSTAYQLATATLTADPRVESVLGSPLDCSFAGGNVEIGRSGNGKASFRIGVTGSKSSGTAYVTEEQQMGVWSIQGLQIALQDGRRISVTERAPAPAQ